jgi:hypothetical protein
LIEFVDFDRHFPDQTIQPSFYARDALAKELREDWKKQNGYGSVFSRMKQIRRS